MRGRILLLGLACFAILDLLWMNLALLRDLPEKDPVTIHEERILPLKALLPGRGEVGYITTVDNDRIFRDEKAFRNVEYLAQYVVTQYTLAPLIVRNSPDPHWVVGNFLSGPAPPGVAARYGLTPLKDFGEGVILFRREPPP